MKFQSSPIKPRIWHRSRHFQQYSAARPRFLDFIPSKRFLQIAFVYLFTTTLGYGYSWTVLQGRNEVYFFIADPVFLPKFLIPDSKTDKNFDPWSRKILFIPGDFLFITPLRHYYTKIKIRFFTVFSLYHNPTWINLIPGSFVRLYLYRI